MNPDSRSDPIPEPFCRYSRQIRFPGIGLLGQQKISGSTALVVGCGALGSVIAESLVRAGVGCVRLVDRDYVELHNLQRQVLFDEHDVEAGLPKVIAAEKKLRAINSTIRIEARVEDVDHRNIRHLGQNVDVIVDGTDNFETRFLINDFSLDSGIPWIYGGCIGSEGQTMTILPGTSNCLHCLMSDGPPPPGTTPGCDLAGILGPVANVIASLETVEALKILSGNIDLVDKDLTVVDLWSGRLNKMVLGDLADKVNCPACRGGVRAWLSGERSTQTAVMCGRNAVQIRGADDRKIDLIELEQKLAANGEVKRNAYLLKFQVEEYGFTVFADGRAIITGTGDPARAKSLYARWIGV